MVISFIATWFKRLGAVCLVFVVFWHLTSRDAPRRGKAMVHLALADHAMVWIDRQLYRIDSSKDTPVVCDLAPGRHVAQAWRNGFMEGEEAFTVEPGRVAIVGPIDHATVKAQIAKARAAEQAGGSGTAGVTAPIRQIGGPEVANWPGSGIAHPARSVAVRHRTGSDRAHRRRDGAGTSSSARSSSGSPG